MKYIGIFIIGVVLGFFLGFNVSFKFIANVGFDEIYDKLVYKFQSFLTGSKFELKKQKEVFLETLAKEKEEIKKQIKDQIKQSINKKIDEMFKF